MKRRSLFPIALMCGTCLSFPAAAVTTADQPSPIRSELDENGVDLVGGGLMVSHTDAAVGPDGAMGIAYMRTWTGLGWRDNISVTMTVSGSYVVVTMGGKSENFTRSGNVFTPAMGQGSSITYDSTNNVYDYRAVDGTLYVLDPYWGALVPYSAQLGVVTKIVYPNGVQWAVNYEYVTLCTDPTESPCPAYRSAIRMISVTSTSGYQLKFDYALNNPTVASDLNAWRSRTKVTAFNALIDPCSAIADTCSFTRTWPSSTYASSTSGSIATQALTDALGRVTQFNTNASNGTLASVVSPNNVTKSWTYDSSYRVLTATKAGATWNYGYSDSGTTRTTTRTDPTTATRVVVSNQSNLTVTSDKDQLGHTMSYQYDSYGRVTLATMPEGNSIGYGYDGRGNVTSTTATAKAGSGLANIGTSAAYPTSCTNFVTCNEPTSTTDPKGNITTYTYDPTHGGVLTVTAPAVGGIAPQTRYTYTQMNNTGGTASPTIYMLTGISACRTTASCIGGADETKTTIGYGSNLRPTSTATGSGNGSLTASTSATYDGNGDVYTSTDPLGHVTRYRLDADREIVGVVGPDPDGNGSLKYRAVRVTYNPDGQATFSEKGTVASQSDADWSGFASLQQVATTYDAYARKVKDVAQAGGAAYSVVQYSYDAESRLQCTAQRMNPSIFSSLPSSACTLGTAGSFGPDRIVLNTYDSADELTQVTSGYGVSGLQRNEATYTYSSNGKVKTLADAKNNLTTYVYDGFDRLSQTQYPSPTTAGSSNTADYEQLGYDAAGNVTSRRLRDGTSIGYGYDVLNRMNSKTLPSGEHGVTYAYDNLGHPTTITGATTLSYGWDALGRMSSETQAYGSVAYQYDLGSRRTRLTWQDGTYLTYDYDNVDEMTAIHENGGTILASFGYDDLGRRTSRSLANGTSTTYGYDAISRLTSLALAGSTNANTATLSNYSPAGEIGARANSNDAFAWTQGANVNRGYTINGLNQFATIAGATQGYDGRGNLTSSGGTTYAYTSENLLKSVSTGQTLSYDPIGRLGEYDAPTATRFVYDGGMISEELNTSGGVLRRYVFGPAGDEPIVWYEGSTTATKRYMDQDERGSVTRITNADGSTYAVNSYDEYGIPGASNQGRFGYTGQAWLSEIGLAYYKARIYSPTLGRFMQTDPIGYEDGPNWYNYVGGNPINASDFTGLDGQEIDVKGVKFHCEITCSNNLPAGSIATYLPPTPGSPGGVAVAVPWTVNAKKHKSSSVALASPVVILRQQPSSDFDPCKAEIIKQADKWGEKIQKYALGAGVVSGAATLLAPESGAEAGIEFSIKLYGIGSFFRSSASVARSIAGAGNGSGAVLGDLNDLAMGAVGVPEALKPYVDQALSAAETSVGADAGDEKCE